MDLRIGRRLEAGCQSESYTYIYSVSCGIYNFVDFACGMVWWYSEFFSKLEFKMVAFIAQKIEFFQDKNSTSP